MLSKAKAGELNLARTQPVAIKQLQLQRFDGISWVSFGGIVSG
jgi:hypothetical protein